jgi:monoterpene epsilon-lactone hydrolase
MEGGRVPPHCRNLAAKGNLMPAPTKCLLLPLLAVALIPSFAQQPTGTPPPGPTNDTSVIDADGTARITRVVPLPSILSSQAKAFWSRPVSDAAKPQTLAERRAGTDTWQTGAGKKSAAVYPVKITEGEKIAGVPVRIVDPLSNAAAGPISGPGRCESMSYSVLQHQASQTKACSPAGGAIHTDRVLICLHGGGFNSDSGSYTESIPIANLTRTRVVSVLYRLDPEHPYPAALDDAVAVYKGLLKKYKPTNIAIYGTSAGAILTGEVAVRLKQLHLPEPGAFGIFSGFGDYTAVGDSASFFALNGLSGHLDPPAPNPDHHSIDSAYTGAADPHSDVLSPNYSDLHGLPPTLFVTSTRDMLLSGASDMNRAWMRDGVPTQMIVFDGLPHAFWNDVSLPESREAYAVMARFFNEHLGTEGRY